MGLLDSAATGAAALTAGPKPETTEGWFSGWFGRPAASKPDSAIAKKATADTSALDYEIANLYRMLHATGLGYFWEIYELGTLLKPQNMKKIIASAKRIKELSLQLQPEQPSVLGDQSDYGQLAAAANALLLRAGKAHNAGNHARAYYAVSTAAFLFIAASLILLAQTHNGPVWVSCLVAAIVLTLATSVAASCYHTEQMTAKDAVRDKFLEPSFSAFHNYCKNGQTALKGPLKTPLVYPLELGRVTRSAAAAGTTSNPSGTISISDASYSSGF